jgi:AmmeMemoRadiSam system protein A
MPHSSLEPASRATLLRTAAEAIEAGLGTRTATPPDLELLPAALREPRASFVTLTVEGDLRGCCGTLEAARPLAHDVWRNAQASAFRDPRFPPLLAHEWRRTRIEVSVLTPCERIEVASEQALLRSLVPGSDGLVLAWRGMRATFLPKVWENLEDPRHFLRHLKLKAGWAADFWATDVEAWRYRTELMATEPPAPMKDESAT